MATVVRLDAAELRDELKWHAEYRLDYTEPMPLGEWSGTKTDLGVVLLPLSPEEPEPALSFVCLAAKGRKVATRFAKAEFTYLSQVDPLPVTQWLNAMPPQFRSHLESAIERTGRSIPPGTWTHAREALVEKRPGVRDHLAKLEAILDARFELTQREQEVLQEQKDAVGVALSVARINRAPLAVWTKPVENAPFLTGVEPGDTREDVLVIHDATRAPGWAKAGEPYIGVTEFSDAAGNALTVMNVNRHKIEEITGVDLLYYRHEPASFAMVQYKRMARRATKGAKGESSESGLEFRPSSDGSFEEELERMRTVDALAGSKAPKEDQRGQEPLPIFDPVLGYRLHPHACWIKLCHPEAFKPVESDLVRGMYLPLDYYEQLAVSDVTLGPKGGRVISYDNVHKWINNTLFVELMSGGWIGSRTLQTAWLSETLEAALSAKRSVVIAQETANGRRRHRR